MSEEMEQIEGENPYAPLVLTPEQENKWHDTMSLMAWTCPGFRHLFYKLLVNNRGKYAAVPTKRVPIAATDGRNILINPDEFFKYSLPERVFIIGHEILHNVYDDVNLLHRCIKSETVPMMDGTTLPFNNEKMQHAMDYRINALLNDSKIGKLPEGALCDASIATADDSVYDVYKKIYEKDDDGNGKSFDMLLPPNASTGQSPGQGAPRNKQQWGVELAAANTLETMRSQGKMPAGLKRFFESLLTPEVPWTEHIKGEFARKVGSGSYNWRRPDRRFIVQDLHMPSKSGHGAGWIVIWGDTSGSIGNGELSRYMAELSGIIEDVRPKRLTILWCDAAIHRVDEVEEASDLARIQYEGVGGGGGTSVHPVMEWIADHTEKPDMFIGFTDGYVSFPEIEPSFPVIWASVTKDVTYPWGEVVHINNIQQ